MTELEVDDVVPLVQADDEALFGAKAVGLGAALRAGLPVPPGFALAGSVVDAVAAGEPAACERVAAAARALGGPLAVRSSCVDEDGAQASFAGQHATVLGVPAAGEVAAAVREIWWSANSDSAITYRHRVGMLSRPSVGVVVQALLAPDTAGVMFTRNPVTGAEERVIEASWGLGEAVVAGRVIPDHFRISSSGQVLERVPGLKKVAIRATPAGGTTEEEVPPDLLEAPCLDDAQLAALSALAEECERAYGPARDIEWAFAGDRLYLLQCRAVTPTASAPRPSAGGPVVPPALPRVSLFSGLDPAELDTVARLLRERRFAAGETVTKEGAGAGAFFLITSGTATVTVRGEPRGTLGPGDSFGEIALIDDGARSATVTALTDLVCDGLTVWDFRPLVQGNPRIAWKLLEALARRIRALESA